MSMMKIVYFLLEEINGEPQLYGYKNRTFKQFETHSHSTFIEIPMMKKGIDKF